MTKTPLVLPLVALLIFLTVSPAQALSIIIDNQGQMVVHQDQVLGDEDESESESESQNESAKKAAEQQAEQTKKQAEQQREQAKTASEQQREQQKTSLERTRELNKTNLEQKREAAKKLRTVNAKENKQLKVKTNTEQTEVLIESKTANQPNEFSTQEVMRTQRLDIDLPANQKPESELEDESEIESETESETETDSESQTLREVRENRQQRQDRLQIKTQTTADGESEVEIESGNFSARLKSAEFVVDPETNQVTVVTPSGQSHTLIHLPDVAIQRMTDAGLVDPSDSLAETELTVETSADGSVVYKTKAKQVRRILGIMPVAFENEVELDDATSQVTTSPTNESLFMQLLRSISR